MNKMSSNDITLQAYEVAAGAYADATSEEPTDGIKRWLDEATRGLGADARILEIGSATGRDARYLRMKGYVVQCSDAAGSFVELLNAKGYDALQLNVLKDEVEGTYDLILANAVFVHFTPGECAVVFAKLRDALKGGGRLAFTVIEGDGEEWSDAKLGERRYFSYWSEPDLRSTLEVTGYRIDTLVSESVRHRQWLNCIASRL